MKYLLQCCLVVLLFACSQPLKPTEDFQTIKDQLKETGYEKAWPEALAKIQSANPEPVDYFRAEFLAAMLNKDAEQKEFLEKGLGSIPRENAFYTALLISRSDYYVRKQDMEAAIKDLDTVLTINPDNRTALVNRGYIAAMTNDHLQAITLAQHLLKLSPGDSAALTNLSYSCAEAGYYKNAIEYALQGLAIVKDAKSRAPLLNNMGLAEGLSGDMVAGMQHIDESLALWPENNFALCNKGLLLIRQGKTGQACLIFTEAREKGAELMAGNYIEMYCK